MSHKGTFLKQTSKRECLCKEGIKECEDLYCPSRDDHRNSTDTHTTADELEILEEADTDDLDEEYCSGSMNKKYSRFRIENELVRQCLAEVLGTCVLLMIGLASIAQHKLSDNEKGTFTTIAFSWGIAVMCGVHVARGVSGGLLNPAVTLAFAIFGRFPWKKVVPYMIAQTFGAFLGAGIVYGLYSSALDTRGEWTMNTAQIFATYPSPGVSNLNCFFTELFGTAYLVGMVFAVDDMRNQPINKYTQPATVGMIVVAGVMAFGYNTGFGVNPARDFGPRLFTLFGEWGFDVFTYGNGYFWIPVVAPFLGGPLGGAIYYFMVELHHPQV